MHSAAPAELVLALAGDRPGSFPEDPVSASPSKTWKDLKDYLHARLVAVVDWRKAARLSDPAILRREVRLVVERLLDEANPLLNLMEREATILHVVADALGLGPLEMLFGDDRVQEIRVDGPDRILVRRGGAFEPADVTFLFRSLEQLYLISGRLLAEGGEPADPAPSSVIEREAPANFWLTARFPATRQEPPRLHFRRLRPAVPPVSLPPPRLPPRELRVFVRFVRACYAAGLDDLLAAQQADLQRVAREVVQDFLAEGGPVNTEERDRLVAVLVQEARHP
jgi:pilus assembly protein CpaF